MSILFRESGVAFFGSLVVHSLAMALVVGVNIAVCLTLLGYRLPITASASSGSGTETNGELDTQPNRSLQSYFSRFFQFHWIAVVLVFLSGALLLLAYPAKALTNPVFYLKLICLSSALFACRRLQLRALLNNPEPRLQSQHKMLALFIIALWLITLTAGRFLAYTNSVLLASRFF